MQVSPPAVADRSSRVSVIEILAYLGIAGGLYGTFLVLSLQQPTQGMLGAVALGLTVVFLLAGLAVGADAPDRLGRLRSVCWYLSVQSFSSMLQAWMTSPTSLLSGFSGMFPIYLLTAVYALGLWLFLPRLLQQLGFYAAVLSALAVLVAPNPTSFMFGTPSLTGLAILFWLGGAAWFALGYAGRVRPPRTAMVLGMLTSIVGPLLLSPDSDEAAFLLVLATSAAFLLLGGAIADRAVTGIGAVGAVVGLVGFLVAIGVDDEASGGAVLALGTGLFVIAVLVARQLGGPRPTLGPPMVPIGPKVVAVVDAPLPAPDVPPPPEPGPLPPGPLPSP
jgi:hypothetical protein